MKALSSFSHYKFSSVIKRLQIKKRLFFSFFIFICFSTMFAQKQSTKNYTIPQKDIEKYILLNNNEQRLLRYKDDNKTIILKLKQLILINASRKKHRKQPVELDIFASRVANKIATQAATENFMGHWNTQGESPYQRFAFAGGKDHIMENASALSSTQNLPEKDDDISSYMQQAHNAFMAEKAPNDGHKQNCINTYHNFVGIGYYLYKNQFRYYEEFVDRYIVFGEFPTNVSIDQRIHIPVKAINDKHIYMALTYYEKTPSKMSVSSINKRKKYDDFTKELSQQILPWNLPKPNKDNFYNLEFTFKKKGLYYIQIFLDKTPYVSGKATTKNKIQASGVVISVK